MRPNDHVDIIGTFKDPQTSEQVAVTLLQNVIVLATGKITGTTNVNLIPEGQREYNNVSLLVIPEEAEILVLAQELGALTLSLRNEDDIDVHRRARPRHHQHAAVRRAHQGAAAEALQHHPGHPRRGATDAKSATAGHRSRGA